MKAISINSLDQVSGGTATCLLSMVNPEGTAVCLARLSEDLSTIEIPLNSVLPAVAAIVAVVKVGKEIYDLYQNSGNYKLETGLTAK